jgi:hypothetical protein
MSVITQIDLTRDEQLVQAGDKAWKITLMLLAHQAETGKWAREKKRCWPKSSRTRQMLKKGEIVSSNLCLLAQHRFFVNVKLTS